MICKKVKYSSEKYAVAALIKIQQTSKRKKVPCNVYLCNVCNCWHLTSKPSAEQFMQLQKEYEILLIKNNELEDKLHNILATNQQDLNSKRQHDIDVDIRVKKMQAKLVEKNKYMNQYRKQNKQQITKILELERKVNNINSKK